MCGDKRGINLWKFTLFHFLQNGMIENKGKLESILANSNPSPFLSNIFNESNYLEWNVVHSKEEVTTFKIGSQLLQTLGDYSVGFKVGILVRPEDIILSKEVVKTKVFCNNTER